MKLKLLAARILCVLITAFISLSAFAYDFEQDGFYYNILSATDKTVSVTSQNTSSPYNSAENYSGRISIPVEVSYNGVTYKVTAISDNAFNGCSSLTKIGIHSGIKDVGERAFYGCKSMTTCNIMSQLTEIKPYTFYQCNALRGMLLPYSLTTIGKSAFSCCSSLVVVNMNEGITIIDESAFFGCSQLQEVTIPQSVTTIGKYAFESCTNLKKITLPDRMTEIGTEAFSSCSSLESITIPEGITELPQLLFKFCSGLKTVTLPSSLITIGRLCFTTCSSLESVIFSSPANVKTICEDAFSFCSSLPDIALPNSVETIEEGVFVECGNLKTVEIGSGIKQIGKSAFNGCKLELLTVNAVEPPAAVEVPDGQNWGGTFDRDHYKNTKLSVPMESIAKYKAAPVWENFFKEQDNPLTGIEGVEAAEGCASEVVARYDLSGRPVADDYRGLTIVRRADGSVAKEICR